MHDHYTPGALRALDRAEARAKRRNAPAVDPSDLLAALLDDPENLASSLLLELGLAVDTLFQPLGTDAWTDEAASEQEGEAVALPESAALKSVLNEAVGHAHALERGRSVGTEHLLAGLVSIPGVPTDVITAAGLDPRVLIDRVVVGAAAEAGPIEMEPELATLDLASQVEAVDIGRILDASANRAQEGLRVVEDYVRFALDDPMLNRRVKDVRHRLGEAVRGIDQDLRLGARDTPGDVGTHIMAGDERVRENPRAVLSANFHRTTEALRSLEEYSKLVDVWLAGRFEVLRYDVYTLEKLVLTAVSARHSLDDARLYLLVGGQPTLGDLTWLVGEALSGGVQVVQLREKGLPDREILTRAREVRILTAKAKARFIMNDRPDLARLSGADGVHLGQDDMRPRDARRILGPGPILGVSTHDREQLERAVLDGAGYLGVGPVFPSRTKDFADLSGLAFVRQAAETSTLPWFAIGGIGEDNIDRVIEAGARRIAVSSAILAAERPRVAAAALRRRLDEIA